MSTIPKNLGFIDEAPREKDWIFGASNQVSGVVLRPDRNWYSFIPPLEVQRNNIFDTYSCVTFAHIHAICTMAKVKYGLDWDKSERFTSKMSNTTPGKGNSLRSVSESLRTQGTVQQTTWPFTETMTQTEFFSPIPQPVKDEGLDWIKTKYGYNWDWVDPNIFTNGKFNPDKAWQALQYSPLITAVDYSSPVKNGLVQNVFINGFNHSKFIVNGIYGKKWVTADSYLGTINEYAWDYNFYNPIRFDLTQLFQVTINDMQMKLVRNSSNGKIYLVDSDNVKHWVKDYETFKQYFGQTAWKNADWLNVAPTDIDPLVEGESISRDKNLLTAALRELLAKFGAKLGFK